MALLRKTEHDRHVELGFCPAISSTKAWCNNLSSCSGIHKAPYLRHEGGKIQELYWTDVDPYPKPL